jgi:hypothetical protein
MIVKLSGYCSNIKQIRAWLNHGSSTVQLWFSPGLLLVAFQQINSKYILDISQIYPRYISN